MSESQMENVGQTDQTAAVEGTPSPSPSSTSLPEQITPIEVVQEFVAAVNSGSIRRELADDCVLSFLGRHSRGGTLSASFLRTLISARYQHEGFEEAAFVSTAKETHLKSRFVRTLDWVRRRMVEQMGSYHADSLHLRAESDDEQEQPPPSRSPAQLVTPSRPASNNLDQIKFVEANGVLKSLTAELSDDGGLDLANRTVHLTLGYRQVPLVFGNGHDIEICLVVYEKYSGAPSSVPIPRRGSAARCNPPTDDEEEDDSHTRRCVRRALFVEGNEEEPEEDPLADAQQEQQPSLEHTQVRVEATTQEEFAQPSGSEVSPAPSNAPRKRHSTSNAEEVEPESTPSKRMRF